MKKMIWILIFSVLVIGCQAKSEEKPAIKIGSIEITASEFESAFNHSSPSLQDSEAKKAFLENYIAKKLILKEAENLGLDKDPEFLLSIQFFWEQSLLKSVLAQKSRELAPSVRVSDQEVKNYYYKFQNTSYANLELRDVYDQISGILLKQKQSQAIQEWVESLEEKVKIETDYQLLGIVPTEE